MIKPAASYQYPAASQKRYRSLIAWQESHKLVLEIYKITVRFPKSELYGLVSQIRRSAVSVTANIVEGQSRQTRKEFIQFLHISKGSLVELEYFFELVLDLNYINTLITK